ncbi:MAG: N-acetylmuramic acid 6-phosphate etherase [Chloroflexi bacterium CFX4]|nr:N-acetylmuramic acid 6-phosphate etherase [Chloroflexi bacterium CFX4]MDL1922221.1 N-acetylmuramic acid 6-phosphate etherase [Chloroflexi bacterium CFX3]
MPYFIGIDGGGTSTKFALVDANLTLLSSAESGSGNPNIVGLEAARTALQEGVSAVLQAANLRLSDLSGIGAGLAGLDRPADHARFNELFAALFPNVPVVLDNDAVPVLYAASGRAFGIVTISGTGMIALGVNGQGQRGRAGGWGHYVDRGSGYVIARDALQALFSAYDRGEESALGAAVLAKLGLAAIPDLVSWLYAPERRVNDVAALAADVVYAAEAGDLMAIRIMSDAAQALVEATATVAKRLNFGDQPFPVVRSGSLLTRAPIMRHLFAEILQSLYPRAYVVHAEYSAQSGAAMMSMAAQGVAFPMPQSAAPAGTLPPRRATERRHLLTYNGHRRPTLDFLTAMNIEDGRIPHLMQPLLPNLAALIEAAAARFKQGGRLIYVGAGTSGRLAVLDAAECIPTFSTTAEQVVAVLAGGEAAFTQAVEGAEDDAEGGAAAMAALNIGARDTVIGIAASGGTPFVIGALEAANKRGALTGCIVNVVDSPIAERAEHPICIPTGAEALMGSTRLKAGTAQKLALNMLSTGVMLRVGRIYENLMTDMRAANLKLRERAAVIVAEAAHLDLAQARAMLSASDGEMKTAIVAARLNLTPEAARARLAETNGDIGALLG